MYPKEEVLNENIEHHSPILKKKRPGGVVHVFDTTTPYGLKTNFKKRKYGLRLGIVISVQTKAEKKLVL